MKTGRTVFIVVASLILTGIAGAQGAKPKPVARSGSATPMPGSGGKIGTPYKLGEKDKELHFTLEKTEFVTRFMIDSDTVVADPDHRILVISFAVQNPAKVERQFNSNSFKFTVVSPDDENFVVSAQIVQPDRRTILDMNLKPAQKTRAIAYVVIHPQGPVNKLIIQRGDKTPVLRYDLHDLVKPLNNVFAGDKGNGSINPGIGVMKTPFELGPFDFTVDSMEDVPGWGDFNPGDGKKVVVIHMALSNVSMLKYWSTGEYQAKLYDEDGNEMDSAAVLKSSSDENFYTNPEQGNPMKYRVLFYASSTAKVQRLVLVNLPSGRSVTIPLAVPGS